MYEENTQEHGRPSTGIHSLLVTRSGNCVKARGDLRLDFMDDFTSAIHTLIVYEGRRDVVIDLSDLTSILPSVVPPLCAFFRRMLLDKNVDFSLIEPKVANTSARVRKLGLAHYICYRDARKPTLDTSRASVLQFMNDDERIGAVDRVVNYVMRTVDLSSKHIAGLDWAVNEITDNVLTHSSSRVGGFLICNRVPNRPFIEFCVADGGVGVRRSLGLPSDEIALEQAVREGVTRNNKTNQGNGLYGTYNIAIQSSGVFVLRSGLGTLFVAADGSCHIRTERRPYVGTYVVCQINYEMTDVIERALVFRDRAHSPPFDYLERHHEIEESKINVDMKAVCSTFGSRKSGLEARNYLSNLISAFPGQAVNIDFAGVHVISSSFADEVFGKLFVELGPMRYIKAINLINTDSVVDGLIDRAITLRSRTGL